MKGGKNWVNYLRNVSQFQKESEETSRNVGLWEMNWRSEPTSEDNLCRNPKQKNAAVQVDRMDGETRYPNRSRMQIGGVDYLSSNIFKLSNIATAKCG